MLEGGPEDIARFNREAHICSLLDHPNAVVDPYGLDLETYQRTAAQVLEALQGIDFESYISPS